jgi:hypothetical protein
MAIVSGASYNGTLGGTCPPAGAAGAPIFTGTQASFVNTTVNLDTACNLASGGVTGCAGMPLYFAFIGISGCGGSGTGWLLDDVTVTSCQPISPPLSFYTVTPCRVIDTRGGAPLFNSIKTFQVAGLCGIPATAKAVAGNLTVVAPQSGGYLSAYAGDLPTVPQTSSISFNAGRVRANNCVLSLAGDGSGTINIFTSIAELATTHVLLDVSGYFQ